MAVDNFARPCKAFGHGVVVGGLCFVPGASPTVTEAWGVRGTLTRNGAGDYTVTLANPWCKGLIAVATGQENDTTTYHFVRVESQVNSSGTFRVSHKSVAYASVASGPALSDTIDMICVIFLVKQV